MTTHRRIVVMPDAPKRPAPMSRTNGDTPFRQPDFSKSPYVGATDTEGDRQVAFNLYKTLNGEFHPDDRQKVEEDDVDGIITALLVSTKAEEVEKQIVADEALARRVAAGEEV
jgi:hypothetical protein